jgi:hypothetical protein
MMIPVTKTPKWQRYIRKYEEAKKRYIAALYEEHILPYDGKGYAGYLWVNVTETLPSERGYAYEWGESRWVSGKEYAANEEQYKEWCHGGVISKLDFARFMFHGWARKAGQSTKF